MPDDDTSSVEDALRDMGAEVRYEAGPADPSSATYSDALGAAAQDTSAAQVDQAMHDLYGSLILDNLRAWPDPNQIRIEVDVYNNTDQSIGAGSVVFTVSRYGPLNASGEAVYDSRWGEARAGAEIPAEIKYTSHPTTVAFPPGQTTDYQVALLTEIPDGMYEIRTAPFDAQTNEPVGMDPGPVWSTQVDEYSQWAGIESTSDPIGLQVTTLGVEHIVANSDGTHDYGVRYRLVQQPRGEWPEPGQWLSAQVSAYWDTSVRGVADGFITESTAVQEPLGSGVTEMDQQATIRLPEVDGRWDIDVSMGWENHEVVRSRVRITLDAQGEVTSTEPA